MTSAEWKIDPNALEVMLTGNDAKGITLLDTRIEQLYQSASLPFDMRVIEDYAKNLNSPKLSDRVIWVNKFLEMDWSLGPGGYALRFNLETVPKTYAFFQLLKYDAIYRPMKYVYMPFAMSTNPAVWSRDIAENACAHIEQCLKELVRLKAWKLNPRATLGTTIRIVKEKYPGQVDTDTLNKASSVNELVYGKTKHKFDVEAPRLQLLSLTESLAVYLVSRILGLKILEESGILADVVNEINRGRTQKGIFIGMEWFVG